MMRGFLALAVLIPALLLGGCGPHRPPVPPGTIPAEESVSAEDEQYGHEVLGELTQQYPLERNDAHINRVRDIVDKITEKGIGSRNPWHVYVLVSSDFKNAAATRGGYIFVWTGLLDSLKSDDELATILAHEIGHVLAGHTAADPTEEATEILSGAAGSIASEILQTQGIPGIFGDLAGELLKLGIQAIVVQPGQRSNELEADLIGMFLLAKSGINPEAAIDFWSRVRDDPNFSNSTLTFLSTHPSSDERLELLKEYLPQALAVYKGGPPALQKGSAPKTASSKKIAQKPKEVSAPSSGGDNSAGFAIGSSVSGAPPPPKVETSPKPRPRGKILDTFASWKVEEPSVSIYAGPSENAAILGKIKRGETVTVTSDERRWLRISQPQDGFVRSKDLSPLTNSPRK